MLKRITNVFKRNVNPSPLMDEQLYTTGHAYVDQLIVKQYNNYLNKIHRLECCYSDPILNALTYRWANIATSKDFKFYDTHNVDGREVMQDYREWWQAVGLNEVLKSVIPLVCRDGHCLLEFYINNNATVGYEIYGDYECSPKYWKRDKENEIVKYSVKYVPRPIPLAGFWSGGQGLNAVDKEYYAGELLHLTRADYNLGFGRSRIESVWDAATKLRHGSHADFFRKDTRFISAVPEGWKKQRVQAFMKTMNDFMSGRNRAFVYKMEQAHTPDRTPLELPRFGYQSLSQPSPKPLSQSEAGGQLLRDPEWARLLSATGHTENYFLGNQAGALTGSEVDLTRDDRTEIAEFGLYEPIIKAIINWFVKRDLIPEPTQDYVIKYWKDWEYIEKTELQAKQQMLQWEEQQSHYMSGETRKKELKTQSEYRENPFAGFKDWDDCIAKMKAKGYSKESCKKICGKLKAKHENSYNKKVHELIVNALRDNRDIPLTPVMSAWIEKVGTYKGHLAVKYKFADDIAFYPYKPPGEGRGEEIAEEKYKEMMAAGSKGGWIWDNILMPPSKYGMESGRLFERGSRIKHRTPPGRPAIYRGELPEFGEQAGTIEEMREYKIKGEPSMGIIGAGTTREPFKAIIPKTQPHFVTVGPAMTSIAYPLKKKARVSSALDPSKLSFKKYNEALKKTGQPTIGQKTYQKLRKATDYYNQYRLKYNAFSLTENSLFLGNPMNFDIPLYYPDKDSKKGYIKEFACKRDWRKIENHTGNMYLYDDLEHSGNKYIVGTYKHWWDEKTDMPVIKYNIDEETIRELHQKLGYETSPILERIDNGLPPEMSTEYYSRIEKINGKKFQRDFMNSEGQPRLEGIAIVKAGNCDKDHCKFVKVD
jgi:hypothetical protein